MLGDHMARESIVNADAIVCTPPWIGEQVAVQQHYGDRGAVENRCDPLTHINEVGYQFKWRQKYAKNLSYNQLPHRRVICSSKPNPSKESTECTFKHLARF
jgi:hypothetical protein